MSCNCGIPSNRSYPLQFGKLAVALLSGIILFGSGIFYYSSPDLRDNIKTKFIQKFLIVNGPDSIAFPMWSQVPDTVDIKLSCYLFNITNPIEVKENGAKPNLTEVGPIVYKAVTSKTNVAFFDSDSIVQYYNNVSLFFDEESTRKLSNIKLTDNVTIPNIPLLVVNNLAQTHGKIVKTAISLGLKYVGEDQIFISKTVNETLWGYTDPALEYLAKKPIISKLMKIDPIIGLLRGQNQSTLPGLIKVDSGSTNYKLANEILTIDDKASVNFWSSEFANEIRGTDGQQMHPLIQRSENISSYVTDLCRSIWMTYAHDRVLHGVTTYRFKIPPEIFELPDKFPDNAGFCNNDKCPPAAGALNISTCKPMDAPVFISCPHFFHADNYYQEKVVGMAPTADLHETFIDIEPITGFVFAAAKRIQVNFHLPRSDLVPSMSKLPKETFLPTMWYSISVEVGRVDTMKWHLTIGIAKFLFLYGGLVFAVIGGYVLMTQFVRTVIRFKSRSDEPHGSDSDEDPLLTESTYINSRHGLRRHSDINGQILFDEDNADDDQEDVNNDLSGNNDEEN